jgi:KDO2-lipid IV(A) lauroyltransferase
MPLCEPGVTTVEHGAEPAGGEAAAGGPEAPSPGAAPRRGRPGRDRLRRLRDLRHLRHLAEYAGFGLLLAFARLLPPRAARGLGVALGRLAYRLGVRRRVVEANLAFALGGERDETERAAIAKGVFEHFGGSALEFLSLAARPLEATRRVVEWRHPERLVAACAAGRGVVLLTGHLGAFEIGSRGGALLGIPFAVVMKGLANPYVNRALARLRGGAGATVIEVTRGGRERVAGRRVLALLRANVVVGILNDQDVGSDGVLVDFFGHPSATGAGPVRFAARTGAPLLSGLTYRENGRHVMEIGPEIPLAGRDDASVAAALAEYNRRLEAAVRAHPEQYFWLHKRWKSQPALRERLYAAR